MLDVALACRGCASHISLDCAEHHCSISPVVSSRIEAESILADDVTWAILPYAHDQYGN